VREFLVDPAVAPHAGAGVIWMVEARVRATDAALEAATGAVTEAATDAGLHAAMREFEGRWAARQEAVATAGSPGPGSPDPVRAMYRRFGVDPTKTRPSSEALRRRLARGQSLPRVNAAVDVCNWSSAEFGLPYGLYDAGAIEGDRVTLRVGRDGEEYAGIRKDVVHVAGRLVVADAAGAFGNPTSDSARTMVTAATRALLVVVYAPRVLAGSGLDAVLEITSDRLARFTGAREDSRSVL
jgi:DNA/RNA-binding domain of Phe-tRNA-synthetase-like protein